MEVKIIMIIVIIILIIIEIKIIIIVILILRHEACSFMTLLTCFVNYVRRFERAKLL